MTGRGDVGKVNAVAIKAVETVVKKKSIEESVEELDTKSSLM